jgi:hypothetical protein
MADVHLLRNADDTHGRRLEEMPDGLDRAGRDGGLDAREPAESVQGYQPAAADDERIDLRLFEDVRGLRGVGREGDGQVAEAEERIDQDLGGDHGLAAPECDGQFAEKG